MFMRKCRWLSVALLAWILGTPTAAWALGLGEIEVDSALNERFSGTIELLDAEGFGSAEIVVSMASREDFDRVGVERFFYLTNLKFEVEFASNGSAIVNVTSGQPMSEPYLNFIVEVLWPNGRLLKEYTVLLDPPTFSQAAAPAVSAPTQPIAQSAPRDATRVRLAPTAAPTRPAQTRSYDGRAIETTRDDTLWKIAQATLPSERVTLNQQMLAIQRLNPDAFIRDNINLLKAGYTLELPSESQALGLDGSEADMAVADQISAWRAGTPRSEIAAATSLVDDDAPTRSQVDLTEAGTAAPTATSEPQGEVRIVANSGELAAGTSAGDDSTLNQLIEEKATLSRQVEELNYQLDRETEIAANSVDVKDRQLEVKDKEIAELQAQLTEMREQMAATARSQNQNNADPADVPWWQTPMLLFGVIFVLVLALAGMLVASRRNRADDYAVADLDDIVYDDDDEAEIYEDYDEPEGDVEPTVGMDDDRDVEHEVIGDLDEDDDAMAAAAGQSQTGDVIGEAEIYIAYGRYGQAANLLLGVLQNEPERHEVRLKLMEAFAESNEQEEFAVHAQYLVENCDDEDVLHACRELEAQIADGQALSLDDLEELDIEADDEGADAAPDTTGDAIGDDDLIDLDLHEGPEAASGAASNADTAAAEANTDEFELEFDDAGSADTSEDQGDGLDAELSFDLEEEGDAGENAEASTGEDLGGDLGIDFDPERDTADEAPSIDGEQADAEELSLDDDLTIAADGAETKEGNVAGGATDDGDFEFTSDGDADINATKLDLAEAYIDMGDSDGARDILNEVVDEGTDDQQDKARELLSQLG